MAEDDGTSGSTLSWHEREITQALQRLANARANLAQLEAQAADTVVVPPPDPVDLARAEELQADIVRLSAKASGRFSGGARSKLAESERQLRLLLHRLGVASLDELRRGPTVVPAVDPTVLEFAQRECADAEKAFVQVTAMVIPDAEPEPDEPDAEVIAAADSFTEGKDLDLRVEPSAAS